jgi:hypothetical protein
MRRFTAIEIGGLFLAALLFLGGLYMVIWPQGGVMPRFTNDVLGLSPHFFTEEITPTGARIGGALSMLFGIGIGALSIYREKT